MHEAGVVFLILRLGVNDIKKLCSLPDLQVAVATTLEHATSMHEQLTADSFFIESWYTLMAQAGKHDPDIEGMLKLTEAHPILLRMDAPHFFTAILPQAALRWLAAAVLHIPRREHKPHL